MKKVVIDPDLQARLSGSELELVDELGWTIGYFVSPRERDRLTRVEAENQRLLNQWGFTQLTPEQVDASIKDDKLYTTEEVLKYLESL